MHSQRAIDLLDVSNGANARSLPSCLAELAMDALSEGITIADLQQPDAPLIYANDGFCRMTGYRKDETVGHNCRCAHNSLCVHAVRAPDPFSPASCRARSRIRPR